MKCWPDDVARWQVKWSTKLLHFIRGTCMCILNSFQSEPKMSTSQKVGIIKVIRNYCLGTRMSQRNFVPVHLVDAKIFQWIMKNLGMLVALEIKVRGSASSNNRFHSLSIMNICTQCYGNPSNCWEISSVQLSSLWRSDSKSCCCCDILKYSYAYIKFSGHFRSKVFEPSLWLHTYIFYVLCLY